MRGGMDASQYKDYVLTLLFIKYISDKFDGQPYSPIKIPKGASFAAMVALKGKSDIGDQINKKIIAPLATANQQLSQSDFPDFNDPVKLGDGKEKVERLTNLVAIFEGKALDFSKNRADGDDILGDAYEYLMRHFATESGKSKGQFYTPAEVSRIMAQILGIHNAKTSSNTTVYDPTCGSGSLLLKVGDEAQTKVTLYGQEKDATTSGLARMNMILHDNPTATIVQGNTLSSPRFKDGDTIKTFDYVVANPPFSDKRWSTGLDHKAVDAFNCSIAQKHRHGGVHLAPWGAVSWQRRSRHSTQPGKGYIKGIIGLPANLFYGTGIRRARQARGEGAQGIFMVDASDGFMKEGPKNRLRSRDIHKAVDAFNRQEEIAGYSKIVSAEEIEKNDFNLNLPRYIDSRKAEDLHDIAGHLQGGIPLIDVDSLQSYWDVCPGLRKSLFKRRSSKKGRKGYVDLKPGKADIKTAIYEHPEFAAFVEQMNGYFAKWKKKTVKQLKALKAGCKPKQIVDDLSEGLLKHYTGQPLLNQYAVYQHLMDYWAEVMQDDVYQLAAEGWKAETYRVLVKQKNGKEKDKGWACDLVPKELIVARYFADQQSAIDQLEAEQEAVAAEQTELEEEHGGEEGAFGELEKINKANVATRLKEINDDPELVDETKTLKQWQKLYVKEAGLKKKIKTAEAVLDTAAYEKYPELTEKEVQSLVVDDKWLASLDADIHGELDRISQTLTGRVKELAERYDTPLPELSLQVDEWAAKVNGHLERMGFGL